MNRPKPRVAIVGGAGTVGSSAAFRLAERDVASELVLVDVNEKLVRSHVMDLEQAALHLGSTEVQAGSWSDLAGSDIVVLSASLPERKVSSRDEYLLGNAAIVRAAGEQIARHCPGAAVLVATNPVDVFTAALPQLVGMEPRRFFGYSWNDTLRFRWAIAQLLDVPMSEVEALVIGEHGDLQLPLFDRIKVIQKVVQLDEREMREVREAIQNWFTTYQGLDSGRTSGWTSAVGISTVVEAFATESSEPVPGSVVLQGEYGLTGVSLGVPARLHLGGVSEVIELALTEAQEEALQTAADKIRGGIETVLRAAPPA